MKRLIAFGVTLCLISSSAWSLKKGDRESASERQAKKAILSEKLLRLVIERSSQPLSKAGSLQPFADLLAQGADVNIHYSCFNGDYPLVKLLLDSGAQVNAQGFAGYTPLHVAAQNGHKEVCELLIAKGAQVDARTAAPGSTPLHLAADSGHKEVCELLIAKGAQVDARTAQGATPLHLAALNGHKEVCELLIANGAQVDARLDRDYVYNDELFGEFTPLHVAVCCNQLEIVKLLLQAGANKNARTQKGRTALDLARQGGYIEICNLLKQ